MTTKMPRRTRKVRARELIIRGDEILTATGEDRESEVPSRQAQHSGLLVMRTGPCPPAEFGATWLLDVWDEQGGGGKKFSVRWNGSPGRVEGEVDLVRLDPGDWEERLRGGRDGVVISLQ